jgi:hypothetical protein
MCRGRKDKGESLCQVVQVALNKSTVDRDDLVEGPSTSKMALGLEAIPVDVPLDNFGFLGEEGREMAITKQRPEKAGLPRYYFCIS